MHNESKQNPITLASYEVLISAFFIRASNVNKKYIFSNYNEIIMDNSAIIKHFESQNVISVMFVSFLEGVQ